MTPACTGQRSVLSHAIPARTGANNRGARSMNRPIPLCAAARTNGNCTVHREWTHFMTCATCCTCCTYLRRPYDTAPRPRACRAASTDLHSFTQSRVYGSLYVLHMTQCHPVSVVTSAVEVLPPARLVLVLTGSVWAALRTAAVGLSFIAHILQFNSCFSTLVNCENFKLLGCRG